MIPVSERRVTAEMMSLSYQLEILWYQVSARLELLRSAI